MQSLKREATREIWLPWAHILPGQLLSQRLPCLYPLPPPHPIPVPELTYLVYLSSHLKPLGSQQGWVRVLGPGEEQETLKLC